LFFDFFRRAFRRAGKNGGGWGGGNFCPRAEAKPRRPALWARKPKQKNFLFLLEEKTGARKIKKQRKFFCKAGRRHRRRRAAGRSEWIFSGIFDKVGSSEIINILKNVNIDRCLWSSCSY